MKLKIIIILVILLTGFSLLHAESEVAADNSDKAFEFSVGGGAKASILFFNVYLNYGNINYYAHNFGSSIGVEVPVSFVFYANNNFGVGFNYKTAIILYELLSSSQICFGVDNYLNMVIKAGNNNKRKFFIMELGLMSSWKNCFNTGPYFNRFYLGPDIFLGYEKRSKTDRFLFTIGGFCEGQFKLTRDTTLHEANGLLYLEANEVFLLTGIELRWRYCNFSAK